MSKGVLGLGCSYTWGEGLYFYSDLDNLPFTMKHSYDINRVTTAMQLYKDRYIFTKLVADYLNTWYFINQGNGGSIRDITYDYARLDFFNKDKFKISDFKVLIYQFTAYDRDDNLQKRWKISDEELIEMQIKWVDDLCSDFEKENVKVITFSWFDDISTHPIYKEKFKNRHIDIELDGITKPSFYFFTKDDKYNITIQSDFLKKGYQYKDLHFNKKGHKIIADLIIKKLERDNFTL